MLVYFNIFFFLFVLPIAQGARKRTHSNSLLRDAFYNDGQPVDKPLEELVNIVKLVQANKPNEIKDFFTKASCESKSQYTFYVQFRDSSDPFNLEFSSIENMLVVSMFGCTLAQVYAACMRMMLDGLYVERVRDITDIMVSISETAALHDDFLNEYGQVTKNNYKPDINWGLENTQQIEDTDTKNVCLTIRDYKRAGSDAPPINVQDAAKQLKDEIGDWSNKRNNLDVIMMETPLNQLTSVFEEFKKLNDGKSLEDTFSEQFHKDANKLTIYKQLTAIATDRIAYYADEINARLTENIKDGIPVAYTIVTVQALSKEDREKVKAEYKKKINVELFEQLDKMLPECGSEDVILQMMKLYMDDLKKL